MEINIFKSISKNFIRFFLFWHGFKTNWGLQSEPYVISRKILVCEWQISGIVLLIFLIFFCMIVLSNKPSKFIAHVDKLDSLFSTLRSLQAPILAQCLTCFKISQQHFSTFFIFCVNLEPIDAFNRSYKLEHLFSKLSSLQVHFLALYFFLGQVKSNQVRLGPGHVMSCHVMSHQIMSSAGVHGYYVEFLLGVYCYVISCLTLIRNTKIFHH